MSAARAAGQWAATQREGHPITAMALVPFPELEQLVRELGDVEATLTALSAGASSLPLPLPLLSLS